MTKKQSKESQVEQSERFRKAAQDITDADELNPTEADEAMKWAMKNVALDKPNY